MERYVPSLEQKAATAITRQTVQQLDPQQLYDVLGRKVVCDLFAHCLQTAEGRAMILTCMSRPRCAELWTGLDELRNLGRHWSHRGSQILVRNKRIHFTISFQLINYSTPIGHGMVHSWSGLPTMYSTFRKAGVTDEEIQCIMGPISAHMAQIFPDSTVR